MSTPRLLPFPPELQAAGTHDAVFEAAVALADLPQGSMRRITRGDLDLLIAHTEAGIVAIDDRCPHMSAPFSVGRLEGCTIYCPLHRGAFDVRDGEVVTVPTTGGLTAEGEYRPTWSPPDKPLPPPATDAKAQARALTRVRRLRYYPLRLRDGVVEVALQA